MIIAGHSDNKVTVVLRFANTKKDTSYAFDVQQVFKVGKGYWLKGEMFKMKSIIKNKRGSVTFIAYIAMLFFAMYGIILFGNSVSSYTNQTKAIENIQNVYNVNTSEQLMKSVYNSYSTVISE